MACDFLMVREEENQIWAKLGREGKQVVAKRCQMEKEQEQTKGNPDYFWDVVASLLHNIPSLLD